MMTNSPETNNQDQNTPRTRNNLFDTTMLLPSPEGYLKDDWTFRKQLESEFRALGFKSHKFSHKKEPETRAADSLWLSWNSDNKKLAVRNPVVTDIEIRVTFDGYSTGDFYGYSTTFTVTHDGRNGGCFARRMGKATFVIDSIDSRDVMAHVEHLLSKQTAR